MTIYNNYPRIYSLSTIGIKQHYNADYLFHPYRTDFSGDSGSGKSMVADMIQLVLVGASDFKSSTDGNKQRDVKGLLVSIKGKSPSRGYVFLNIEVKPKKFIVIGAYIEGTSNAADMFVIQNGYDWESLTPLEKPMFTSALLPDDKIETLPVLCEKITFARMKSFKKKNYHRILHNSCILALDLTKESTLKAYGNILRSFSRGKGFKTESENLKKFLFGDEEQGIIMDKYKEEVANINNDFHEHKRYLEEIQLINEKQKILQNLLNKNKHYKATYTDYLKRKFGYWNTIREKQSELLKSTELTIGSLQIELKFVDLAMEKLRISDLKELLERKMALGEPGLTEEDREDIESSYLSLKKVNTTIEIVQNWLREHNGDIIGIQRWYEEQQALLSDKYALKSFVNYLDNQGIKALFEVSGWYSAFADENAAYPAKIGKLDADIADLRSLSMFSDVGNSESLLRWAIGHLEFPLSLQQESVLVYFQKFGKTKPMKNPLSRYVPFPETLFQDIESKIKETDDKGFWIDLDGVYEYIPYIAAPVLNVPDPNLISGILEKLKEGIDSDIARLISEKQKAEKLRDILFKFGDIEKHVELYRNRETIESMLVSGAFESLKEYTFEMLKSYLEDADRLRQDFLESKKKYEDMIQSDKAIEESLSKIKSLEDRYQRGNSFSDLPGLEAIIAASEQQWVQDSKAADALLNDVSVSEKLKQEKFYREISNEILLVNKKNQLSSDLEKFGNLANKCIQDCKDAENEIKDAVQENNVRNLNIVFDTTVEETSNPDQGGNQSLRQSALAALLSFEQYLNLVTEDKKFDVSVSMGQLAGHFLPTVFPAGTADEDLIGFNIAERLHKLTQDIQEIGSRKIEILGSIFNEVYKVYSSYLTKITQIDNYLKNNNRIITGGNRASLSSRKSLYYPDTWLSSFRKQLNTQMGNTGLFSELREELDINKMMIQAFQQLGGSTKVEPEDLMNPLSYFDLEFDLKLDNDEVNSGSNGQTYAANALLCLARLSLIEDKAARGLKVMPIDEAEGLGSNYDMLHELAKKEKYQIITMAIETAGEITEGDQYIYIMNENKGTDMDSYVPPFGIFSDPDTVVENISEYINSLSQDE